MDLNERINVFAKLGDRLKNLSGEQLEDLVYSAEGVNTWFDEKNIKNALKGIERFLTKEELVKWVSSYSFPKKTKNIGLVLAGNIPAVGFHDVLCVLIAGCNVYLKLSSKDRVLMSFLLDNIQLIDASFSDKITLVERLDLSKLDAVIATGSDNTARYFEQYFSKVPNLIRKNRTSVAVLKGSESKEELSLLGDDIFTYFGLGCRNVSKVFVPKGYNFSAFFEVNEYRSRLIHNSKYSNNYDYNKSIYLVNRVHHFDNGFLLVTKNEGLISPLAVLYYEEYDSIEQVNEFLFSQQEKIQVVVGKDIKFGDSQSPSLSDYADGVDTLQFLCEY